MGSNENELKERRYPRVKARVLYSPPRVFGPPRMFGQKREISDISLGGVRIYSDEILKEGKVIDLELYLPSGHQVKAMARVVWIIDLPIGSEAKFDVGLEFIHLPPYAVSELERLIAKAP